MSAPRDSAPPVDQLANELRVALTVIKSFGQLLARRKWEMAEVDRALLQSRLSAIDDAVNRAADRLEMLLRAINDGGQSDRAG